MNSGASTTFLWRTAVGLLCGLDYFLFSTGNISLTFSLLGGWFEILLLVVGTVSVAYGVVAARDVDKRRYFYAYVVVLVVAAAGLYSIADPARQHAIEANAAEAAAFMQRPDSAAFVASPETRELMERVGAHDYSVEREAFTPTFRRADYLLKDSSGNRYRLILTFSGAGTPEVTIRQLN